MHWEVFVCEIHSILDPWGRPAYSRKHKIGDAYAKDIREAIRNAAEDNIVPGAACTYVFDYRFRQGKMTDEICGAHVLFKNRSRDPKKWDLFDFFIDSESGSFGGTLPF